MSENTEETSQQAENVSESSEILDPTELLNPEYERVAKIGHTVHIPDYEKYIEDNSFYSGNIMGNSSIPDKMKDFNVLWFNPVRNPNFYDWRGNVNFRINFEEVFDYFDYRAYLLDYILSEDDVIKTRVLFSKKTNLESLPEGTKVLDYKNTGLPVHVSNGNVYVAKRVESPKFGKKKHGLDVIIEPSESDSIWLFSKSNPVAVNHVAVPNKIEDGKPSRKTCWSSRLIGNNECNYKFTATETAKKISNEDPLSSVTASKNIPIEAKVEIQPAENQISCSAPTSSILAEKSRPSGRIRSYSTMLPDRSDENFDARGFNGYRRRRLSTTEVDERRKASGLIAAGRGAAALGAFSLFNSLFNRDRIPN